MTAQDSVERVEEEYLVIREMFDLIEKGERDGLFYLLRDHYTAIHYHLNLFHLACVRAFQRFESDRDIQYMCLGAFEEYSYRPHLVAFRSWFETLRLHPDEMVKRSVPTLLELCDLGQAQADREMNEDCERTCGDDS